MPGLEDKFYEVILLNECSGNIVVATRFSYAGGASGWSFGVSQMDVSHSENALKCLEECGFSGGEIAHLIKMEGDRKEWSKRLPAHADTIRKWDLIQLSECLGKTWRFIGAYNLTPADDAAILMCADTINQFGSLGRQSGACLGNLGRPFTAQDLFEYKLAWKYGEEHPKDVQRRYDNILRVVKGEA
jgi:hypothetical protein